MTWFAQLVDIVRVVCVIAEAVSLAGHSIIGVVSMHGTIAGYTIVSHARTLHALI